MRTPPRPIETESTEIWKEMQNNRKRLKTLQLEEDKAFVELGNKLSIINSVASNAKNIHKPIRDNLICVMALYQQIREYRDAISNNPCKQRDDEKQVLVESKSSQTEQVTFATNLLPSTSKNIPASEANVLRERRGYPRNEPKQLQTLQTVSDNISEPRGKRLLSVSPKQDKIPKRQKTSEISNVSNAIDQGENTWTQVTYRKKKKKKNTKQRNTKESGVALTIKTSETTTYAEMLKQMKTTINPTELGVEINEMRRTKKGELLIKLKKDDGQFEKLKEALTNTLGNDVTIRSATKTINVDIRDMDESTEADEIVHALIEASGVQQENIFKILNIRESYGKTKQALVQIPINIASKILAERRIKIGWIRCRIREKVKVMKCYRCLDQGHLRKDCKGVDRTDTCRRCCEVGHKSDSCCKEPRCILCQQENLQQIKHYIGSSLCISNRRNLVKDD